MNAYLLVLEVAKMGAGETYSSLPLHCTLVHWFWLDTNPDELAKHVRSIAEKAKPLKLSVGREEKFTGKTRQGLIPLTVNLVERTPELSDIHMRICEELDTLGARYTAPDYVKKGFCPHITHVGGESLADGDAHTSPAIYVIGADAPEYGNKRHVYAKIELHS